jgi:uncharacterized protein YkwD
MVTTLLRRGARIARRPSRISRRTDPPRLEALECRTLLSAGLQPTAQAQWLLQQLNAIRANPAAYGQSIGLDLSNVAPAQPLAFSTLLDVSAQAHSQDMNDQDYFNHVSPNGSTPDSRMTAAGFNWDAWGESIAAGFSTSASALQALIVDQGVPDLGHRIQLLAMSGLFQGQNQVGIGIASGSGTYGTYYTIDTAHADGASNSFLTGVVFNDANHNGQYGVGEGLGGVTVTASNGARTTTFGSGGYSLELAPGTYTITFSGGGLNSPVKRTVTIGNQNVEVDVTNPPPSTRRAPAPVAAPIATQVATQVASKPSLAPIANQNVSNATGSAQVGLTAADPSGRALAYQVSVQGSNPLAALRQQFNFHADSSGYHQDNFGQNEKLVVGSGNALWGWYEILPDGTVRPWLGGNSFGATVATLGSAVWNDPSLLTNASASASGTGISGSVSGNTLTLTGLQGYTGALQVSVTASDGIGSATQSFQVNVSNAALSLASIANVAATHGSPVQVALNSSAASGRTVNYQVQVTGDNPAYDLEQSLGLDYTGNYLQNAIGMNEKWLQSSTSNLTYGGWYAILPDGEVRPWVGGNSTGATVARLTASVYADPSLLYNATAPTANASVSGSVLTLSPPGNLTGSLQVTVVASDGTSTTSRQFTVTLT